MPTATTSTTQVTMPQLGESVTEGTIGTWLKQAGDRIEKFDPLVEVVTDKVNAEIPSPIAGILREILVEPETTVPVGAPICVIDRDGDNDGALATSIAVPVEPAAVPAPAGERVDDSSALRASGQIADEVELLRTRSSPVVRRIAAEHGIDLQTIAGSGVHGRVTKRDILAEVERIVTARPAERTGAAVVAPEPQPAPAPTPAPPVAASPRREGQPAAAPIELRPGDVAVPLSPMRRAIADHLVRSVQTAPHVTTVMEVDMLGVVAARDRHRAEFRQREGIDLTYLPFAIKAVSVALRDHPRLNSVWDEAGGQIVQRAAINIGVAVGLEDGLVVPVIRHADRLSVTGLAHAVSELAGKARAGTLVADDLSRGTITVNNPGTFGSIVSTPILVQPQAAIISTEAIVKRPVVVGDAIAIRPVMNLSLSIDHRVLDGLAAARFLRAVKDWLESVDAETGIG